MGASDTTRPNYRQLRPGQVSKLSAIIAAYIMSCNVANDYKDIDRINRWFWSAKVSEIHSVQSLKTYTSLYLAQLGKEYEGHILKAISQLSQLTDPSMQAIQFKVSQIVSRIDSSPYENHLDLWNKIAVIVDLKKRIQTVEVRMSSRQDIITYIKHLLLFDPRNGIWPEYDIAYRIVDIEAHYHIASSDKLLYKLWDLATELEAPGICRTDRNLKWDQLIHSLDRL